MPINLEIKSILKYILISVFGFISNDMVAHTPDFSNLMIYEQNGKTLVVIRSSLSAFEGEVDYKFGKNAYKTPEEFKNLAIEWVLKNCKIVANGDTLKLKNPQINLGHETVFFAELENMPSDIKSLEVINETFKDMPHNQCELVLTLKKVPTQQFIINQDNNYSVNLKLENDKWVNSVKNASLFNWQNKYLWIGLIGIMTLFFFATQRKKILK